MRLRLLLAGWATLALAACGDDGPSGEGTETSPSTSSTTGDASRSSSTGPGSSTGTNPSDDTTTSTTTTGSDSSTGEGTTLGESSSGGSDTGTTTGAGVSACEEGCVVEAACGMRWASEDECVIACEANLVEAGRFSPFCQQAWENVSECVGTLTCEEFVQWETPTEFPYPCSDADVGLEIECEGQ